MRRLIHIVSGEVNAGKTARMRALYGGTQAADGLLSEKIYIHGQFTGYRLAHLRSGETMDLALLDTAYHGQFAEACRLGPFVFSQEAFHFGYEVLRRLCADPAVQAVFLDEAGPLELRGLGFADAMPGLIGSGKEIYLTVRTACLEAFLQAYGIADYHLIKVEYGRYSVAF